MNRHDDARHPRDRSGRFTTTTVPASADTAATVASAAEQEEAMHVLAGDYETHDGITGLVGELPGTDLPADENGWKRHTVFSDVAGNSTGDYSRGFEHTASYVNEKTGRCVEYVTYVEHDGDWADDSGALPPVDQGTVIVRLGDGFVDDNNDFDIDDYSYARYPEDNAASWQQYGDSALRYALEDERNYLAVAYKADPPR